MTTEPTVDRTQRKVICAAILYGDFLVCGARHYDTPMHSVLGKIPFHIIDQHEDPQQGFIDQWGKFMSRHEAFEVATAAGQIIQKTGNPNGKELYSEDLY